VDYICALKTFSVNPDSWKDMNCDIAIVGMAGIFPQAKNLQEYWQNIVGEVDCITDVPSSRWNIDEYYDRDPSIPDKTYCKRGGFIPDIDFNPLEFGLPPNILEVTDVSQLLSLVVAKQAMEDAGYGEASDGIRSRTGVVLGIGGGQKLITPLTTRLQYPVWEKVLKSSGFSDEETQNVIEKIKLAYIKWEENSFPGMLGNVIAGRIANRLDLGGMNCVVDAACASSLSAVRMALSELTEHRSDMMITGGVDTDNSIFMYMSFSKTPAFSKRQKIAPFDADSDGMLIGEGIGMMVLKRLEDAKRDGDRIYSTIKGIGTSSDGKYKSIYAPRCSGQVVALNRAYEDAGFSPETVGLIEAHGTGTMAGDPTEFEALNEVFSNKNHRKDRKQHIALGSVKSQIGHTKSAAGAASLIKAALALHHKVLPPTININKPNPKLQIEDSPFYLNTETRPWIPTEKDVPRRAGVSSFGFGGTNYHVVLEEYEPEHNKAYRLHYGPASILLHAATPAELLSRCQAVQAQLNSDEKQQRYIELINSCQYNEIPLTEARVGFVSAHAAEAVELLRITIDTLKQEQVESWEHPQGIYYRKTGIDSQGKVVALFSGQGSQYLEMGKELAINFPQMRQAYENINNLLRKDKLSPVSSQVFPFPTFDKAQKDAQITALQQTENAQPAIAAFSVGLYKILQGCGFKADFAAGHSFGELAALWCAGVMGDEDYFSLVNARLQAMASPQNSQVDRGAMVAVTGNIDKLRELIADFEKVIIANWNSHNQVVLSGTKSEIIKIQEVLDRHGYAFVLLPVSAGFHTPLMSYALKPFSSSIKSIKFNRPSIPVFSNVTADVYPGKPEEIRNTLKDHIVNPVLFKQEIENIYRQGGYVFVEFGSKNILANLVKNILGDKPHFAIALNSRNRTGKNSDRQLREAVIQLRVAGLPLGDVDSFKLEQAVPTQTKKGLNVRLNGSNYVSEKTKAAFEQALQDGYQVKSREKSADSSVVNVAVPRNDKDDKDSGKPPSPVNGKSSNEKQLNTATIKNSQVIPTGKQTKPQLSIPTPTSTKAQKQPMSQLSLNEQPILGKFEQMMMRFYDHQSEILRVHEQYLKNQAESSQTFFGLMQSQFLGLNGNGSNVSSVANGKSSTSKQLTPPSNFLSNHQETTENGQKTTNRLETNGTVETQDMPLEDLPDLTVPTPEAITNNGSQQVAPAAENIPVEKPQINKPEFETMRASLLEIVSDKTGYPAQMLDLEMDMEADLGIDSIKRVEILGAMQESFPDLGQVNPEELAELRTLKEIVEYMTDGTASEPVAPAVENTQSQTTQLQETNVLSQEVMEGLTASLLEVVSDKTGYPAQMLELEMDMEADLGIDSIKRVEILGAMQELFPDLPQVNPEELAELRTLAEIVENLAQSTVVEKKTLSKV
jgi:polyketide-type polyunsaturated fatty acid synthase PfaA